MLDRMKLDKPRPQIRNPNFCGQQQPQYRIKQKEQRAQDQTAQHQVQTALQQNVVLGPESKEEENVIGEENNFIMVNDMPI